MKLLLLCPQWGHEHLPLEEFVTNVKAAGYDGVEMGLPAEASERKKLRRLLDEHALKFVAHQHQATGNNIQEYCRSFEYWLHVLAESNPLFINSHSGRDYFTLDEQLQVLDTAAAFAAKNNIEVLHETHRGRMFYCPANADVLLNRRPETNLTADFSHWVCVSENLRLAGFEAVLEKAIARAGHLHARVGFEEGPQISDPRLPEWQTEVEVFAGWWQQVLQRQSNKDYFTITPEFGPVPYMWRLPHTQQPVADQWEINLFLKNWLKDKLPAAQTENAETAVSNV